ncbi:MAG: DNA-processing protein DprA [Desulfotomaculaceae bacterium]|nr:DNA-processing protein DprA [Desulfotomaculaceae bacterium]
MEDRIYWLGWQFLMPGSGKRLWTLVEYFGSPRAAWEASARELARAPGIGAEGPDNLAQRRANLDLDNLVVELEASGISFTCHNEPGYPEKLLSIYDPPPVIFVRGRLEARDSLAVAMVGSRKPSPYGQLVAERLAKDLAAVEVTVISGMARGIDTVAHKGALAANGRTLAVMGSGLDVVYPRENKRLMEQIIANGAVISEFPPGSPPEAWHFPARNRIISGLALATVVVEAGERSGALITADFALEQGRDVMAVPGNIVNPLSRGPHRLIKQGAKLVEDADDILDELGLKKLFRPNQMGDGGSVKMSADEEALYQLLELDPVSLDELIVKSGLTSQKVMTALMYLEIKGFVRQMPGKSYTRTGRNLF